VLRGEIVALDHYHPLGGKIKGQGQRFITSQELPSLTYFTATIQIVKKNEESMGLLSKTRPTLL
jgi:hypothetical protein